MQLTNHLPPRRRVTPLIAMTLLLHAALPIALIFMPHLWKWVVAILLGNHVVLTLAGLWPRSSLLGANMTMLSPLAAARNEIALTIDDGPNPAVTPKVLDLLDRHHAKATFFCIGKHAAKYPDLCRDIIKRGHAIENHTQHHRHYFSLMGIKGLTQEIREAQSTLSSITGRLPQFFRAPAGLRNPFLDPVLTRLGLRLTSWTRRGFDTRTADPELVTARLLRDLRPGAILLLHDGNCAQTASGIPVILDVLPRILEAGANANLRFVTLSESLQSSKHA